MKRPMALQFEKNEDGKNHILLDGKEIHHVKEYKIESSAYEGKAELSIRMLVQFPVSQTTIRPCGEEEAQKILFLCDGEVPDCRKEHCYKKADDLDACHHTSDVTHALHFKLSQTGRSYVEEPQPGAAAQITTE